jgi:flagellar motor switch protein FliM
MSQLLKQKAIDQLLAAALGSPASGDAPSGEVQAQAYSPAAPLGDEKRLHLEAIQRAFADRLAKILSLNLRASIAVEVLSVEEVLGSEFVFSLGTPCAGFRFPVGPERSMTGVIDWGMEAAASFVDRLLGGAGDAPPAGRRLTPIEQSVVRNLVERSLAVLADAWKGLVVIHPQILAFEANPANLEISRAGDRVLASVFAIHADNFRGMATVALPFAALQGSLRGRATGRSTRRVQNMSRAKALRPLESTPLRHARLTLVARLPAIALSASEVARLRVGATLDTGLQADGLAELYVNERLLFRASVGRVERHLGLRVAQRATTPPAERPVHVKQGRVL